MIGQTATATNPTANKKILVAKWGLFAVLILSLFSCNKADFKNVSVADLNSASETNKVILDVRQPDEFSEGHVPGAILIPLDQLPNRSQELNQTDPIYVICRSGNRSAQASKILADAGFKDIRNVQGGFISWTNAGYPSAK